jgi:hypothetical protein
MTHAPKRRWTYTLRTFFVTVTVLTCWLGFFEFLTRVQGTEPRPLFDASEGAITFKLKDKEGKTPRLVLFTAAKQAETASSINFWRGTLDSKQDGVLVEFKGIRFLRSGDSDDLVVRLVGTKNEMELPITISLPELESGKPQKLRFGPITMGPGPISGTTDTDMVLSYNSENRTLTITKISGQLEWRQLLAEPQKDGGSLRDITGDVGEIPPGAVILKARAK